MSHKTNDLFHNFFFPYLMQDRAYPLDIDEALSTNEYVNKIGKITKSVIEDITSLENRVERLEGDMPTTDEIIALAEEVVKDHVLNVKWDTDHFVDFDGVTIPQHDLYDVFLKGAVILQMRVPEQMETEGYKNITAICCAATAPTDEDPVYTFEFVYLDHKWILRNTIKGNTLSYSVSTNITSFNFDIWNEDNIILTPDFNNGKMYKNGDMVYSFEDFYNDYKDKKNVYVKFEEYGFTRVFVLQAVEELAEDVTRVIFYNTQFNGFDLIDWSVAGGVESITIDHKTYGGASLNHIHLYCDGAGICYFDQKDSPDMEYLTFDEIKGIIENDTNIVFITNGYYSFYSKYYYHTAISQQDTDAIGFIGETQLNGHAYSWRIAINEHDEVTEDEIRLVGLNEMDEQVIQSLIDNERELTDSEQAKIEEWLGLSNTYLTYYNTMPYVVNNDYAPAHKKYVDEAVNGLNDIIGSGVL